MVLPFILGAAAIGAGVTGIKKGIDAVSDNSKAKQLQEDTRAIYEISERDLKGMDLFKEAAAKLGAVNLTNSSR